MSSQFNPYCEWLGIPPQVQQPNHYQLLGIRNLEDHQELIKSAANERMSRVVSFKSKENSLLLNRILSNIIAARDCLLDPTRKAEYDNSLKLLSQSPTSRAASPPPPPTPPSSWTRSLPLTPIPPPIQVSSQSLTKEYHVSNSNEAGRSPVPEQIKDTLVRNVAIAAGTVTVILVAVILVPYYLRDKWEIYEKARVVDKLEEADRLQQVNPLLAYKAYDEVLKEAQLHKITDEDFSKRLAVAEKAHLVLYQKVQDKIKEEEAQKRRLAEEEAKRVANEKRRIAAEQERKRAAEEAQRIADEKQRAEEKRRKEAVSVYRNAPQSARTVLNVVKKLEARTEVGITYGDYANVVGEAWGEVKIFVESPDGKLLKEFSQQLMKVITDYKSALDIWRSKIKFPNLASPHEGELDRLQQLCWSRAGMRLRQAESLLDADKTEATLATIAADKESDEDMDAKLNTILTGK